MPNLKNLHWSSWFRKLNFCFCSHNIFRILKILCKINVKIFDQFVFVVPYSVLLYLPDNALLYLALIRPVFCTGAIVKPNWNKVCKNKKTICHNLFRWSRNVGLDRGPTETKSRNVLSMYFFIAYLIQVREETSDLSSDEISGLQYRDKEKITSPHDTASST